MIFCSRYRTAAQHVLVLPDKKKFRVGWCGSLPTCPSTGASGIGNSASTLLNSRKVIPVPTHSQSLAIGTSVLKRRTWQWQVNRQGVVLVSREWRGGHMLKDTKDNDAVAVLRFLTPRKEEMNFCILYLQVHFF